MERRLSHSASSTDPAPSAGGAPMATPKTRKSSRCLASLRTRIHSSVTSHSPSVISTMSPRDRALSSNSCASSSVAAVSGVWKLVPPPRKVSAKSRTWSIPAGRSAGKRKTCSLSAEENRMPTKSRPPCRAWSSRVRAHALAHASGVTPPGPSAYMECEVSTQAMTAPRPVACSPWLS